MTKNVLMTWKKYIELLSLTLLVSVGLSQVFERSLYKSINSRLTEIQSCQQVTTSIPSPLQQVLSHVTSLITVCRNALWLWNAIFPFHSNGL